MNQYETVDGACIDRIKMEEGDRVLIEHEDGEDRLSLWTGKIVGGVALVDLQDVPAIVNAPVGEWVRIRRG